jgi:hypothetical protein
MQEAGTTEPREAAPQDYGFHSGYVGRQDLNDSPRGRKKGYFCMYQPVMVSSSTFSLVCRVIRLTTIIAMTAITNA